MGLPSNKRRSALRPGKRERARVKKHRRGTSFGTVGGVGTYALKAGPKKWREFHYSRNNPFGMSRSCLNRDCDHCNESGSTSHLGGEPYPESGGVVANGHSMNPPPQPGTI